MRSRRSARSQGFCLWVRGFGIPVDPRGPCGVSWAGCRPTWRAHPIPRRSATTEPFACLGFARYESHEDEPPMAIRWRLEREIPAAWLPVMALAV